MKISASFLSIQNNLKTNIEKLDQSSIDYLHVDIMDGNFVSNQTWDIKELEELLKNTKKPKDIHLMVENIEEQIKNYSILKPAYLTFHLEAAKKPDIYIDQIKKHNIKVGISIKPTTPIETLKPYLDKIDLVLIMSVEPGMGGQTFLQSTTSKLDWLYQYRKENHLDFLIEVDGGINDSTIGYCKHADIAVVGSYITNQIDYEQQIKNLKKS